MSIWADRSETVVGGVAHVRRSHVASQDRVVFIDRKMQLEPSATGRSRSAVGSAKKFLALMWGGEVE